MVITLSHRSANKERVFTKGFEIGKLSFDIYRGHEREVDMYQKKKSKVHQFRLLLTLKVQEHSSASSCM